MQKAIRVGLTMTDDEEDDERLQQLRRDIKWASDLLWFVCCWATTTGVGLLLLSLIAQNSGNLLASETLWYSGWHLVSVGLCGLLVWKLQDFI
jgi:hypothetical protein